MFPVHMPTSKCFMSSIIFLNISHYYNVMLLESLRLCVTVVANVIANLLYNYNTILIKKKLYKGLNGG